MIKQKIVFPLFILVLSPLIALAQPKITLSKAYWEFGAVKQGTILKETLTFGNNGSETLEISARSSCPCIKLSFKTKKVAPASKAVLKITYDTREASGKKNDYIFIDTNDPENETISWIVEGEITAVKPEENINAGASAPTGPAVGNALVVELYSTPNCSYCLKLKEDILPSLEKKYGIQMDIRQYTLDVPANYEKFILLEKTLKDTGNELPAVFVANRIIGGKKEIKSRLESVIRDSPGALNTGAVPSEPADIRSEIADRIKNLKFLPIVVAGLIDGINPCAFAGMVFLVGYLGMVRKRPSGEIIGTGMMFVAGIFITYYLIGIGLSKIFHALNGIKVLSRIMYIAAGVAMLVFAALSIYDYFSVKAAEHGKETGVVLQLPLGIKKAMHGLIEKYADVRFLVPFGFVLGVMISFLEFFCTGQIYLPTIMYMVRVPELKVQALLYLFLYSVMFIIPLLFVFAFLILSVRSGRMQAFGRKHVKLVKLANGIIFLFLAILMFLSI